MQEQVMVVPRAEVAPFIDSYSFHFIRGDHQRLLQIIEERHLFIDRARAEVSPEFKQIIPYVLLTHERSWFLLRRTPKQTEARLHDKLSLGIGGHINPDTPSLLGGLQKELEEEVEIGAPYDLEFAGLLNDDTTEVGRVHLGAVYVLRAAEPRVSVRETEKMSGAWADSSKLREARPRMETWSQLAYDAIIAPHT